jgi:hypothetical protein
MKKKKKKKKKERGGDKPKRYVELHYSQIHDKYILHF